ncbi:dermaseptin-H3-like [Engystomops pustulosus]|uniref:dermaseptin-H3-like n=1 Tax=Engystomops pustulosus TaxID=76066 RepID=UPI003AFAC02E
MTFLKKSLFLVLFLGFVSLSICEEEEKREEDEDEDEGGNGDKRELSPEKVEVSKRCYRPKRGLIIPQKAQILCGPETKGWGKK